MIWARFAATGPEELTVNESTSIIESNKKPSLSDDIQAMQQ